MVSATGGMRARRPRYGHAESPASTTTVGTKSSAAYLVPTASAATGAASRYTGQRNAAVRTAIHAATASRQSAGAS